MSRPPTETRPSLRRRLVTNVLLVTTKDLKIETEQRTHLYIIKDTQDRRLSFFFLSRARESRTCTHGCDDFFVSCLNFNGLFIPEEALSVWKNLGKHLLCVWLFVSSIKTGTRRIIRLDELSSVVRPLSFNGRFHTRGRFQDARRKIRYIYICVHLKQLK